MPERLNELQNRFAAHLRDPARNPAPADVEDRRMAIYRDLFFRNLSGLLARSFPVLKSLYDDADWAQLVREFFSDHRCRTPLFPEIPREFLQYIQDRREDREEDPPFMLELAHYEWVEIALDLDERDLDDIEVDYEGDLREGIPIISPLAWPLSYRYPVHRIRRDYQPPEPPAEPTHLLVYRDREQRVRFMQLNAVSLRLIMLLKEEDDRTGQDVLMSVARELQHPDTEKVLKSGAALLADLRERDVILGCRPQPRS